MRLTSNMIPYLISILNNPKTLYRLAIMGVILRIIVFVVLNPVGPDPHDEVLKFIAEHHKLPNNNQAFLACHPPLYYLTALPFYLIGGLKFTQFFSLIISCFNLIIMAFLLKKTINDVLVRTVSFLVPCFSILYINYSLIVSNDALAIFMGTLFFFYLHQAVTHKTNRSQFILAALTGLSVLTKATFLPFIPVTIFTIFIIQLQEKKHFKHILLVISLSLGIIALTGGYKYVDNYRKEGKVFVHNLDIFPLPYHAVFYKGLSSLYNCNIISLIKDPNLSSKHPSQHAAPLLLYGTFWYKHFYFENNLGFGNVTKFRFIGSLCYILAIIPTLLLFWGMLDATKKTVTLGIHYKRLLDTSNWAAIQQCFFLFLLLLGVATMLTGMAKYNDFSFFHSRLLAHLFYPITMLLASGLTQCKHKYPMILKGILVNIVLLAFCSVVYYSVEASICGWNLWHYGNKDNYWYTDWSLGL